MKDVYEIVRNYMIKPKSMMTWRDVPGYEGLYQISNHGDIRNIKATTLNEENIHLVGINKSIQSISRRKLFNSYWKKEDQYRGEERWVKLDHYGEYYVSNFNQVKRIRKFPLTPTELGFVALFDGDGNRKSMSVIKIFLNTFPIEELDIDHDLKTIKWNKKQIKTPPIDEDWRDIPGFEGRYQISKQGRVRATSILQDEKRIVLTDSEKKRHNVKVRKIYQKVFHENFPTAPIKKSA